jgi:threonine dehydrogenase-like Zn-dependent dehydrogenase
MRALFWDGNDLTLRSSYRTPVADRHNALVKVCLAGVCSTDLQILQGYMGFHSVPGHEFVGTVSEGPKHLLGQRVVGEINFGCSQCDSCRRGLGCHCPNRTVMGILNADGAFAEFVSVPVANLHVVPETVSDEEAVFTEPLAAAFEIVEQIPLNPGDEVLVLGDGKLGSLCAQALKLSTAHVTVVGKHVDKLRLIRQRAIRTVLLGDWQPQLFDVVVEATGSAGGLELAMNAVRPRGTLVLKSTIAGDHHVSLAPIVIKEIAVIGSRCGPFGPALEALAEKNISVTPLIEKIYPLSEGLNAVAHAGRPGTRKILLRP